MNKDINSLGIHFTALEGKDRHELIEDVYDLDGEKLVIKLAGGADLFMGYDQLESFISQLQHIKVPNNNEEVESND